MTVCVAALCSDSTVVGASDRMITAGDVEFQPPQTKVFALTSSVALMLAGNASLQTEILYALREQANLAVQARPQEWLNVRDVADWYYAHYQASRDRRAEQAILAPLGLTRDSFISRQRYMKASLLNRLASELVNFEMPQIEAIISGVDTTGPHIYVADNRGVTPRDSAGFAAIGAGYWHADSQFMFAGHSRSSPIPEVLFLTYAAKRRAEVAPGVGGATDMFMIGPSLGSHVMIAEDVLTALGEIYERARDRERVSQEEARQEVNQYVEELARTSEEAAGPPTSQAQPTPSDDGGSASEEAEAPAPHDEEAWQG